MEISIDTKATAQRYAAAVQAGDAQALKGLFAPDATWTLAAGDLPIAGTWRGRDTILNKFLAVALTHYQPDSIEIEVTGTLAESDQVVMQWTSRALTHAGGRYENECIGVFTIRDGRIHAVREYMDTLYARDHAFGEAGATEVRREAIVSFLEHGDADQARFSEDVVLHSPVTDYHGRGDVAHLLSTIAAVLDTVSSQHQMARGQDVITDLTAYHKGRRMTGLVSETYDQDGRVREATLLLRPLRTLNEAIDAMRDALERSPLPSSI